MFPKIIGRLLWQSRGLLRLCALNPAALGSLSGQGTSSQMPQLKIPHAGTKTQHNQINKEINSLKNNRKKYRNRLRYMWRALSNLEASRNDNRCLG